MSNEFENDDFGRLVFSGNVEKVKEITIYLDADIVGHFKTQAENSKAGYQTLINQTLREKITGVQTAEKADELIERLLQEKNALSRLKAELETI